MERLVLIDGNAIMHRSFHALPKTLTNKKGQMTNAVYGFTSMLFKIVEDLKPNLLAVCFDRKEPTFRKIEFEDYQSHRPEMDEGLKDQFPKVKKLVESFNIPIYEKAGFEADDVIGTIAKKVKKEVEVIIVTGDKDILQLVDDKEKIRVYLPIRGLSDAKLMDEKEVKEKMGVDADQIVDYKGFVGDPSDNYKGVPGIGPKTAEKLLEKYKTFKNVYKNIDKLDEKTKEKLGKYKESADMSFKLAKIVTDVDIKFKPSDLKNWSLLNEKSKEEFENLNFKSLQKRAMKLSGKEIDDKPSEERLKKVALFVANMLKDKNFAFRGTTSLFLQGVDMNVDDIDIVCDKETALYCNKVFKDFMTEKVSYKKSEQFKSYFGKFVIEKVLVEVMGEWQVKIKKGWSRKYVTENGDVTQIDINGHKIPVTKIETELLMFADMGRWKAYQKIKKFYEKKNQRSLF